MVFESMSGSVVAEKPTFVIDYYYYRIERDSLSNHAAAHRFGHHWNASRYFMYRLLILNNMLR